MSKFTKQATDIVNKLIESEVDADIADLAPVAGVEGEVEEIREVAIGKEIKDLVEQVKSEEADEESLAKIVELADELIALHTPKEEIEGEELAKTDEENNESNE